MLENAGFRNLHNVVGGTAAWIAAGLDIEIEETSCAVAK
jgi:rhodanese-related sulfurtransferase